MWCFLGGAESRSSASLVQFSLRTVLSVPERDALGREGSRTKSKAGFAVWACPRIARAAVELYNITLRANALLERTGITVMMDNEALYDICPFGHREPSTHQLEPPARAAHLLIDAISLFGRNSELPSGRK